VACSALLEIVQNQEADFRSQTERCFEKNGMESEIFARFAKSGNRSMRSNGSSGSSFFFELLKQQSNEYEDKSWTARRRCRKAQCRTEASKQQAA
jgi:hypothetical protein